jgi:hypothetical protein
MALDALADKKEDPEPPPPKKSNKGALPQYWGAEPNPDNLGEIDEDKLRRKTQKALIFWCKKHGDDLKPIRRASIGKVNEATLRTMLTDSSAFKVQHWIAVDKALKKLALAETKSDDHAD